MRTYWRSSFLFAPYLVGIKFLRLNRGIFTREELVRINPEGKVVILRQTSKKINTSRYIASCDLYGGKTAIWWRDKEQRSYKTAFQYFYMMFSMNSLMIQLIISPLGTILPTSYINDQPGFVFDRQVEEPYTAHTMRRLGYTL